MFLTENVNTAAPSAFEFMSFLNEADNAYARICMDMAKTEHTAIMSESTELLSEGLDEFKEKVVKICGRIRAKFVAFIDRVKAEWSKLVAKVQTLFAGAKAKSLSKNANAAYLDKHKVEVPNDFSSVCKDLLGEINTVVATANNAANIEAKTTVIKNKLIDYTKLFGSMSTVRVDDSLVTAAEAFLLDNRKVAIKNLENMKKAAIKLEKEEISNAARENRTSMRNSLSTFTSTCSKLIVVINKFTGPAVKVITTWKRATRAGKKDERDEARTKTSSVTDSFDDLF